MLCKGITCCLTVWWPFCCPTLALFFLHSGGNEYVLIWADPLPWSHTGTLFCRLTFLNLFCRIFLSGLWDFYIWIEASLFSSWTLKTRTSKSWTGWNSGTFRNLSLMVGLLWLCGLVPYILFPWSLWITEWIGSLRCGQQRIVMPAHSAGSRYDLGAHLASSEWPSGRYVLSQLNILWLTQHCFGIWDWWKRMGVSSTSLWDAFPFWELPVSLPSPSRQQLALFP